MSTTLIYGRTVIETCWKAIIREKKIGPEAALAFLWEEAKRLTPGGEEVPWWLQNLIKHYEERTKNDA